MSFFTMGRNEATKHGTVLADLSEDIHGVLATNGVGVLDVHGAEKRKRVTKHTQLRVPI